jgi:hypothetical protein
MNSVRDVSRQAIKLEDATTKCWSFTVLFASLSLFTDRVSSLSSMGGGESAWRFHVKSLLVLVRARGVSFVPRNFISAAGRKRTARAPSSRRRLDLFRNYVQRARRIMVARIRDLSQYVTACGRARLVPRPLFVGFGRVSSRGIAAFKSRRPTSMGARATLIVQRIPKQDRDVISLFPSFPLSPFPPFPLSL